MIHAPRLMPDESAVAYWGRVLRLNAVPATPIAESAFTARARRRMIDDGDCGAEMACVVSAVAGASLTTLVRSHTLVPLSGAVLAVVDGDWCDDSYPSRELRWGAMRSGASRRVLCPMCAREDVDFWGFSYWRRSHHVTSIVWCQKHGCPLFRSRESETWQSMPHEVMQQARPERAEVVAQAMENTVLRRYVEVCTELLQRTRPLSTTQVVRALTERARACGLATNPDGPGRRLSDLAVDRISGPWQAAFWGELSGKPAGAHVPALDGALTRLRAGLGMLSYALAIALLYDSCDDAFWELGSALPSMRSLVAAIDAEATRPVRNEPPRTAADNARRCMRLRQAVELVLSGSPIHVAARFTGWAPATIERTLVRCFTAVRADESVAPMRTAISSHR